MSWRILLHLTTRRTDPTTTGAPPRSADADAAKASASLARLSAAELLG